MRLDRLGRVRYDPAGFKPAGLHLMMLRGLEIGESYSTYGNTRDAVHNAVHQIRKRHKQFAVRLNRKIMTCGEFVLVTRIA